MVIMASGNYKKYGDTETGRACDVPGFQVNPEAISGETFTGRAFPRSWCITDQAVKVPGSNPGIPNFNFRVIPGLQKSGGFYPRGATDSPEEVTWKRLQAGAKVPQAKISVTDEIT